MTKKRIFVILHLSFAFAYLFWIGLQPYLKHGVIRKSEGVLFESVVTDDTHFSALSEEAQKTVLQGYKNWAAHSKTPYRTYFSLSLTGVSWLMLSLAIAFLWLFKIDGAGPLAWLLPFLVIAHGIHSAGAPPAALPPFFPTEAELQPYLERHEVKKKREQIMNGWHDYLCDHWAIGVEGSTEEKVAAGNFNFNLERIKWIMGQKGGDASLASTLFAPTALLFFIYLLWNGIFAWILNRRLPAT